MTKADKKDEERKEQLETEALMDAEVEAATDCGPVSQPYGCRSRSCHRLRMWLRPQQEIIVPSQPILKVSSECCSYMSSFG